MTAAVMGLKGGYEWAEEALQFIANGEINQLWQHNCFSRFTARTLSKIGVISTHLKASFMVFLDDMKMLKRCCYGANTFKMNKESA